MNLRRNPNISKETQSQQNVKSHQTPKKSHNIYVCGLGSTGSLGMARYYKPEKLDSNQIKQKDVTSNTFRRLGVFSSSDKLNDVACGFGFTVLAAQVKDSGHSAFGFGINSHSQIGYHAMRAGYPLEIISHPAPIVIPESSPVVKVSCGRTHSILLNKDGHVFSLGNNSLGQCGRPIKEKEEYFGRRDVHRIESLPENVIDVKCGQDHSMFLTSNGKVYSCGWSADGQTGLGHFDNQPIPAKVKGDIKNVKIVKLSSCCDTVLALDNEGNVFGWGNSEYSQFRTLADSESEQFNQPRLLRITNVPGTIVDIAAGGTICAVLNDKGQVFVWGFGILGKGPRVEHSSLPTLVPESLFGMNIYNSEIKVIKIFAGHSNFAAITNQGDMYAWGKNRAGNLGLSHGTDQYFPMKVDMNLGNVKKVALGLDHTCAIVERIL